MKKTLSCGLVLMLISLISGNAISAAWTCGGTCESACCARDEMPPRSGDHRVFSAGPCCAFQDVPCRMNSSGPLEIFGIISQNRLTDFPVKDSFKGPSFFPFFARSEDTRSIPGNRPAGIHAPPVPVYLQNLSLLI